MTESKLKTPEGMHTITPHIVVNDAAAAADWYKQVLGAEERSRIEVPGGKLMQVELWFGDSVVMLRGRVSRAGRPLAAQRWRYRHRPAPVHQRR